jgi:D-glycero-alpha-D-manno-heptose 1-phosphate guanylyltransferase
MRGAVAILAGGAGTRLRPAIGERQKVLAEVNGRPFLAWILDQIAHAGFRDVVLCTGFGADAVEAAFGAAYGPLRLRHSREPAPLGTGGALRRALPLLRGDVVLALNGDSFCDVDLAALWAEHQAGHRGASLVLVEVEDTRRYGRVEVDPDGRVRGFTEKQEGGGPGWINAGIYAVARAWLEAIPADRPVSLERDVLPQWVEAGLYGYRVPGGGRFIDIGTPRSYADASRFFAGEGRGSGS